MNIVDIKGWIVESLKKDGPKTLDTKNGIIANWESQKAADHEYYDGYIKYTNNNNCTKIFFSKVTLEDSINFKNPYPYTWNEDKLERLIQNIQEKFIEGGEFKIEMVGNTDFKLTKIK